MKKQQVWVVSEWAEAIKVRTGVHLGMVKRDYYLPDDLWLLDCDSAECTELVRAREVFTSEGDAERAYRKTSADQKRWYQKQVSEYQAKLKELDKHS